MKNKSLIEKSLQVSRIKLISLALILIVILTLAGVKFVNAQSLQDQINDLSLENTQIENTVNNLQNEAASYQDAIAQLQSQITGLQIQIDDNTIKQAELQKQIDKAEIELEKQRELLTSNIRNMYIEGEMSTIEMLASSYNLSEFVDKQQYRESVRRKIIDTLARINDLKHQLKGKKEQVDTLIKEQEGQRAKLANSKNEQSRLLSLNQTQQSDFNKKAKENKAKIAELIRQQAIQNAQLFGSGGGQVGGGGYPWGNAPCLSGGHIQGYCLGYEWGYDNSYINWKTGGYAYRNCTDWVAYRVRVAGKYVPSGLGNAKNWDDRAPGYNLAVGNTPRVGAAAVSNTGNYGHVMYVEAVNGNGSIVISDYNRAGPGEYGVSTLSASTAATLSYVYF